MTGDYLSTTPYDLSTHYLSTHYLSTHYLSTPVRTHLLRWILATAALIGEGEHAQALFGQRAVGLVVPRGLAPVARVEKRSDRLGGALSNGR